MTGLAFVCGVLPMAIATGAGGASQQALGTSVMGGMIAVVILALLMVPVFFVSVQRVLAGDREKVAGSGEPSRTRRRRRARRHAPATGIQTRPSLRRPPAYWIIASAVTTRCVIAPLLQRLQYLHQFPVHELIPADHMPGLQRIVAALDA